MQAPRLDFSLLDICVKHKMESFEFPHTSCPVGHITLILCVSDCFSMAFDRLRLCEMVYGEGAPGAPQNRSHSVGFAPPNTRNAMNHVISF